MSLGALSIPRPHNAETKGKEDHTLTNASNPFGPQVCHGVPLGKLKFNTFIQKIPCQAVCQEVSAKENKTNIMEEMEQLTDNYNFI